MEEIYTQENEKQTIISMQHNPTLQRTSHHPTKHTAISRQKKKKDNLRHQFLFSEPVGQTQSGQERLTEKCVSYPASFKHRVSLGEMVINFFGMHTVVTPTPPHPRHLHFRLYPHTSNINNRTQFFPSLTTLTSNDTLDLKLSLNEPSKE